MLKYRVVPYLRGDSQGEILSRTLCLFGIGESAMEAKLREQMLHMENPTLAPYAKEGSTELRITAKADTQEECWALIAPVEQKLREIFGDLIYGADVKDLAQAAGNLLLEHKVTLATAESCTGGLIAQRITSVPGSSEVFGYGFVTYWEAAKARLVGVEPDVIAKYNVVSAPVAAQMALGAAQAAGAEIGISVTGVAGPTGGDALRPVGTVYLGAARGETVYLKKLSVSRPDRALVRARAAQAALELALRLAQGKVPAGTEPLARNAQHSAEALDKLNEVFLGH